MRWEDLRPAHVRRAIDIYMRHAWPDGGPPKPRVDPRELEDATTLEELFAHFARPGERAGGPEHARYVLQLGNRSYPFMKFVVQEYLVDEEYFFSVDTHDDLEVPSDHPDYDTWQELRRFNARLKEEIETAWKEAGLPTHFDLRELAEGLARVEREGEKRAKILVVDDDEDVAHGLLALLDARGYEVELALDGRQVLDRLERDPLPDLVLLDYAMPEHSGEEVLRRMRAQERTAALPVLMATASSIELERMASLSGLLRKPYPRELLFTMLRQLLQRPTEGGGE